MAYNKSEIMKRAWNAVKSMGMTLSDALKASWKKAKQEVKEKHISERKDDVFYRCKVNKITSEYMVILEGKTYNHREELRKNGFEWVSEMKIWKKIFKNRKSAEKFLYAFNCTRY